MRILFTTHEGGIAGSTFSIFYLAKGLSQKGHNVHVACKADSELAGMVRSHTPLHFHEITFDGYLDVRSLSKLKKVVDRHQIEIINPQAGYDRTITILAKWFFRLRAIVVFTRRQRPRDEPWLKRWFHLSVAKRIVVVSDGLKEMFLQKGYPSGKLVTIDNGVPLGLSSLINDNYVEKLKEELGLKGPVIGCVSRLKSQHQLINALSYLPDNVTLLFVGIEKSELRKTLDRVNPKQRIIFTGRVQQQEALHYFKLMDVNVLASIMDGFGLVLVEAMLLGVPVIGTNRGGIKSVIEDGYSGLLFEDGDVKRLALLIDEILSNSELSDKLIQNGFRRAQEFSIDKTVVNHEKLFVSLYPKF